MSEKVESGPYNSNPYGDMRDFLFDIMASVHGYGVKRESRPEYDEAKLEGLIKYIKGMKKGTGRARLR